MTRPATIALVTMLALALACSGDRCSTPCEREPDPFRISVFPDTILDATEDQICVFLIEFENVCPEDSIHLSVQILEEGPFRPGYTIPIRDLVASQIGEVEVRIYMIHHEADTAAVAISAQAGDALASDTCVIFMYDVGSGYRQFANEVHREFVMWIQEHMPEFGIGLWTSWEGSPVRNHIIGSGNYLFFSDDWEMGLNWPIVPPPRAVSMYLRRRHSEIAPSYALVIRSWPSSTEPSPTNPPDTVMR